VSRFADTGLNRRRDAVRVNAPSVLFPLLLVASLFGGCVSESGSTVEVSVMPQNHSGKPYTFRVQIFDSADGKKFDKNYTMAENAHTGPVTKLSLPTGTYRAQLNADRTEPLSEKTTSTSTNFAITTSSKQVAAMIEPDESLKVRVS